MGTLTTSEEREQEAERFAWLFNNCQNRMGVYNCSVDDQHKQLWYENEPESAETRDLTTKDIKVTVKWSKKNNNITHIRTLDNKPHAHLGIKFEYWRKLEPEQKLIYLTHLIVFLRYPEPSDAHWSFLIDIWVSVLEKFEDVKELFNNIPEESLYPRPQTLEEPLDIDYVRGKMLHYLKQHSKTDKFVKRGETELHYKHDWFMTLDHPRIFKKRPSIQCDSRREWVENATEIKPDKIEFSNISDKELIETVKELEQIEKSHNFYSIPPIKGEEKDDSIVLIENAEYATLLLRSRPPENQIPILL